MILNRRYRILAWFLSLAFALPILIKTQHVLFPNHEHHCHSCTDKTASVEDICEILAFDYFYFTPAGITNIPVSAIFKFENQRVESTKKSYTESKLSYSLRAPPIIVG
ncbi:hypothetical protein [Labilibaculum manganireducens]|uniref:hypothetical protein n=1 Tax=Labilibaculum manganireducens TaxID=1940525 RepID=UPI000C6E2A37|nr:hypothetical protein [Labilibaculum manganireducens]